MADDMLEELMNFYIEMGIYSCEFHCKHFEEGPCKEAAKKAIFREKKAWEDRTKALCDRETMPVTSDHEREKLEEEKKALLRHGQFTQASSAYVGPEYEGNGSGCRLLFLSLDPGSEDSSDNTWPRQFRGLWDSRDDPSRRTPRGRRAEIIKGLEKDGVKREWVHWYGTHWLAARILQKAADGPASDLFRGVCEVLDDRRANRTEKERKLREVTPYFAHANVVKCSIGRLGNAQAPPRMYKNCRAYLKGELPILKPDIIVAQGREAGEVLKEFDPRDFDIFNHRLQYLILNGNQPDVLGIQTIHPRNGVSLTEGGPKWRDFTTAARDFMTWKRRQAGAHAG